MRNQKKEPLKVDIFDLPSSRLFSPARSLVLLAFCTIATESVRDLLLL